MNNKEYEQQTFESYMGGYLERTLPFTVKPSKEVSEAEWIDRMVKWKRRLPREINPTVKEIQAIEDACQTYPPGINRETLFHLIMEQTGEETNEELLELERQIYDDLDQGNGKQILGLYGNKYKKQKYNLWIDRLKLREFREKEE
tara:strand:- start:54 stop:488 length:435 start_codon:yes stop_codon:yes gene_type:complete